MMIFTYHLLFMLLLMVLYILPASVSYRYLPERHTMPPVYGTKASSIADITSYPHHVLIVYGSKYCSGSLIYSKIVLTAASCFIRNNGESVIVKVGTSSMTGIGQIIPVLEYKTHEYFEQLGALDNDIALLVLQDNVVFRSTVMKAVFVEPEVALRVGTAIMITGWGGTNQIVVTNLFDGVWFVVGKNMPIKYLNLLIKTETTVLNKTICQNLYENMITPSNFCVRYVSEQYLNDNGGGAVYDETVVGILSTGITDEKKVTTAIVTNVSYFHRWITLNTKRFLTKYCTVKDNSPNDSHIDSDET